MEETQASIANVGRGTAKKDRKPISEYEVIQNVAALTSDKGMFRELNRKCVKAMGQVDSDYETARLAIMKWADADSMSDLDQWQTVTDRVIGTDE